MNLGRRDQAATLLLVWSLAQLAHAQRDPDREPVLHEYLAPDGEEDVAPPPDAAFPPTPGETIQTPSGPITPPNLAQAPEPRRVYQETREHEPSFRPDRDTRRPEMEPYDDPFSPSLTPFKRLQAFDAVREDYALFVRGAETSDAYERVDADGSANRPVSRDGEERFFGDMTVQLQPGELVRIPTVGPGARLLRTATVPAVDVSFWRDGADNWFVKSDRAARVRLLLELAISRETFGSRFANVSWVELPAVPTQPAAHRQPAVRVAQAIGVSRSLRPAEVVSRMVEYFRAFVPSTEPPHEHEDIYLDLALSRKGVCRHRAFAFLVTALNIGIPTRVVTNEAHAWVEVHDGSLWHRIDLGGAAAGLDEEAHLDRPPHVPPPDPYGWPAGPDSGASLAQRQRDASIREQLSSPGAPGSAAGDDPGMDPLAPMAPVPGVTTDAGRSDPPPDSSLSVLEMDRDIFRGYPLHVRGRVMAGTEPCARVRVDLAIGLEGFAGRHRLGSLSTDDRGFYDGAVVLPLDLPVGDHDLVIVTAGNEHCGPGEIR